MSVGVAVSIAIFIVGLTVGFFKWLHGLVVSIKELATRFDERSLNISRHLAKIDETIKTLANADTRLMFLEESSADHEGRIRNLEQHERTHHGNITYS